ncbi:MAG: hypothetical protein V4719_19120 [Planctomycetota bacterium]
MAAAASSKPGMVHYFCAFFAVCTLILGVALYLSNSGYNEREATWQAETKKASDALNSAARSMEWVASLKKKIGREFDTIGTDGEQNGNTVLGAMNADIALAGDLAQQTYSATLLKQVEENNALKNRVATADTDIAGLNTRIQALEGQYNEKVKAEELAKSKVETSLATVTNDSAEARTQKDKEIDEQRGALKQSQDDYAKLEDEFKKHTEGSDKRIKNLTMSITELKDEIRHLRNYGFEQPLGLIRSVDTDSNTVTINLGKADRLSVRTTFSVYTKANSGVARGSEDIKGSIEVTKILGPHLASAIITGETMPSDPISPADPIYTPAWSPGRFEKFAFVGKFDLTGDGKDDNELLKELIATNGAMIGAEVDQKGVRNNRKIDHDTKFLVIGEIPDPTEISEPEERRAVEEVRKHRDKMKQEADELGITVVRKNDFLSWMGYRPQYKVTKAGDARPNPGQGSRSNGNSFSSGTKNGTEKKSYEK